MPVNAVLDPSLIHFSEYPVTDKPHPLPLKLILCTVSQHFSLHIVFVFLLEAMTQQRIPLLLLPYNVDSHPALLMPAQTDREDRQD